MLRLAVRVRREDAELALAELLELAPGGVEEVDCGDVVEYAVYGAPGELPALPDLRAAVGGALVDVSTSEVADDWNRRWREFHRPVVVGSLRVRAPWHDAGAGDIVIDPGQAFGTGAHATTRLCLQALCDLEPGGPLVDVGCGSGVLGIAAAHLGWAPVLGLDHEPQSVEATTTNARANRAPVAVRRFDLRTEPVPAAPTIVANLLRPLLVAMELSEPPRTLVAGGLLVAEGDGVTAALGRHGLREVRRLEAEGWLAVVYQAA
ncbi:MAG: ribosomal protein methyltransferase [Solirubrobacteraceae bacterium]|nr:ribosomal protein methyltransferase [Solirubrobacteraceae bacterium]